MSASRTSVLLLEDSLSDIHLIRRFLADCSSLTFIVTSFITLKEALKFLETETPDVILTDMTLPDSYGIETFRALNRFRPNIPIVVMTGLENEEIGLQTVKEGAQDYFIKADMHSRLIAKSLSYAIERKNAERQLRVLNEELRKAKEIESAIAASIQRSLLIEKPPETFGGVSMAFFTNPSLDVDGDFFDFFVQSEGVFDFVIADVMGKGVPAALIAAAAKAAFLRVMNHLLIESPGKRPEIERILDGVNAQLAGQLERLASFITLIYARVDVSSGILSQVNCGHPSAIHYFSLKQEQAVVPIAENMPLGLIPKPVFRTTVTRFAPDDFFFFYTDGITEARDNSGNFFGVSGLCEVIQRDRELSPKKLILRVRDSVKTFSGRVPLTDDFTAVVIRIGKSGRG